MIKNEVILSFLFLYQVQIKTNQNDINSKTK